MNPASMAKSLLSWYDENRRILPWREDPAPFHVWLSEIMLQQTRVEAVRAYYERFLATLPDIPSLAEADEETCMKLWEGLGYYSRIRNLHLAARRIMEEYGGTMPEEAAELRKLPGIGDYTAAAISSIAFGGRAAAVDGNLLRVFARMTSYGEEIKKPAAKKAAEAYFLAMMDAAEGAEKDKADAAEGDAAKTESTGSGMVMKSESRNVCGDINQALMDLGAMVCLPNSTPLCESCPWEAFCTAHAAGRETEFPVMADKKQRKEEKKTVFVIRYDGKTALRRRPETGLLAGLWEFPNAEGHLTQEEALKEVEKLGFRAVRIRELPGSRHIFTHKEWNMTAYEIAADELTAPPAQESGNDSSRQETAEGSTGIFLVTSEEILKKYAIPTAFAKYRNYFLRKL